MEPGELEVLGRGVYQGVERHESDDFALLDVDAFFRRERPDRFERLDERRLVIINHVHGHLYEPAIREFESFRPYGRQSAVALPNGLGDSLRDADIRRPEVHVPGDEDGTRSDDACARGRMEPQGAEIRPAVRIRRDLDLQTLIFPTADVRQSATVGTGRGGLVQVDRHVQLVGNPLSDRAGEADTIVHRDARDGDKGEDVESSHPWMFALVTIHVDPLHGLLRTSERGLGDTSAIANERDYGAIVVRVHLLIKDSDPGDGADGLRDCVDDILAAALGEIGDALDDLRHGGPTEATNVRVH